MLKQCKYLTIDEEWLNELEPAQQGELNGLWLDEGEVAQVWSANYRFPHRSSQIIGKWAKGELNGTFNTMPDGSLWLLIGNNPKAYQKWGNSLYRVEIEVVRLVRDYTKRLRGLFDTDHLRQKRVTVVGLGSGGSRVALELARCGVGYFKLIDFDRLQTHNLTRHSCTAADLGRYKTLAVADLLRQASPVCTVETLELDVQKNEDIFADFAKDSDLVIAATDSEASKHLINRICWESQIPSVYGAAYNRAFGGDVVRVIPPETACYHCFQLHFNNEFGEPPKEEVEIDYGTLGNEGKVKGEPGLGLDVGFIALILARTALGVLLKGTDSSLEDLPSNHIMWGNRSLWVFEKPLESLFIELPTNPDCPVCQPEAYARLKLGLNLETARDLTAELLANLSQEKIKLPKIKG
jgi:molybdopterin/thiamine biosynthesis adenylyltransferase